MYMYSYDNTVKHGIVVLSYNIIMTMIIGRVVLPLHVNPREGWKGGKYLGTGNEKLQEELNQERVMRKSIIRTRNGFNSAVSDYPTGKMADIIDYPTVLSEVQSVNQEIDRKFQLEMDRQLAIRNNVGRSGSTISQGACDDSVQENELTIRFSESQHSQDSGHHVSHHSGHAHHSHHSGHSGHHSSHSGHHSGHHHSSHSHPHSTDATNHEKSATESLSIEKLDISKVTMISNTQEEEMSGSGGSGSGGSRSRGEEESLDGGSQFSEDDSWQDDQSVGSTISQQELKVCTV